MSYSPNLGRWLQADPTGFTAGDTNLYRFVGNSPVSATDPTGLWTWRLSPSGRIEAVAEDGDTVNDLIAQGYDKEKILGLATKAGIGSATEKVKAGSPIDITDLLPDPVKTAIRRQQNLPSTDRDLQDFLKNAGAKEIPPGGTLGGSGVDLMQLPEVDEDTGRPKKSRIRGYPFGWGNCYGLLGLCRGRKPPPGVEPQNLGMGWLKGEPFTGSPETALPDRPGTQVLPERAGGKPAFICPEGGLLGDLTKGRNETKQPRFGAIGLFRRNDLEDKGIRHGAFVLGRSRNGTVYLLQKLDSAAPYTVSPADHPYLKEFGVPTYYE